MRSSRRRQSALISQAFGPFRAGDPLAPEEGSEDRAADLHAARLNRAQTDVRGYGNCIATARPSPLRVWAGWGGPGIPGSTSAGRGSRLGGSPVRHNAGAGAELCEDSTSFNSKRWAHPSRAGRNRSKTGCAACSAVARCGWSAGWWSYGAANPSSPRWATSSGPAAWRWKRSSRACAPSRWSTGSNSSMASTPACWDRRASA